MKMPDHSLVTRSGKAAQSHGFTRMELVVVMLVTGVLFLLGASAQANFSRQSRGAICLSNLKQLTTGWILYTDDHAGLLPLNDTTFPAGNNWAHGWLDFAGSSDNTNVAYLIERQYATLGPYTRNASLYRCPSDTSRVVSPRGGSVPRVRSYAMNGFLGTSENRFDLGGDYRTYKYMSDVIAPRPSDLSVFYDVHPSYLNSIIFKFNPVTGQSTQFIDYPAYWHNNGGTVSFADGHVIIKQWQDKRTLLPVPAGLVLPSGAPDNPDVRWISEHSTSLPN